MNKYKRASLSLLLMLVMTTAYFAVLAAPAAAAEDATAADQTGVSGTGTVDWKPSELVDPEEKLEASLAQSVKNSDGPFKVHVYITDREAANAYFASKGLPLVKGVELPGLPTSRVMQLSSTEITSLATNPGIMRIEPYVAPIYDRPVVDSEVDEALRTNGVPVIEDYDVDFVHGATDAWALGWTGSGVNIAVIDTGFDMAHPDLQGQQARYSTGGPYDGWPIVYDDMAALYWSYDMVGGWIADTSYVSPDFGGFVEFDGKFYDISSLKDVLGNPVWSQSGLYKLGYHTDANLMDLMEEPIAVLVVDSVIPGFYDTVYVDVTDDWSFSNDKACTMGDEISYFDFYDASDGSYDFSNWNAGDGFADLSGGMVYWISDGVNVLPFSDWWYGAMWTPSSGDAVGLVGEFGLDESHGTMTASAALAQGRTMGGQLMGMAPDAKLILIPMTNDYVASWLFAEWGADAAPGTGDEANIVSNSYGFSDQAIAGGYNLYDIYAGFISNYYGDSLWMWSTGNGGPGYGTCKTPTDINSVHVGAGTTMQYRYWLGYESDLAYTKWGDVAPFSNSGPSRTGKLNAEIIASGMYSMEPAPLNQDWYGGLGDGSVHFQLGSGTSHATPTVAGGTALGYEAYMWAYGSWPAMDLAKAKLMASADDMHFDPFKQGAGWLNASNYVKTMSVGFSGGMADSLLYAGWTEVQYTKAALYPGFVYGTRYETYPNLLLPGEYDDTHIVETINWDWANPVDVSVTSEILLRTGSDLIQMTTPDEGDQFLDITGYVPSTTDLVKVTMYFPLSQFDPELDYITDVYYMLEMHDWVDFDGDGMGWNSTGSGELFRYIVDGSECNYNQVMLKDPIDRTNDGLIARIRAIAGAAGIDMSLQLDYYELQPFPWVQLRLLGDLTWSSSLSFTLAAWSGIDWEVNVSVPSDTPVGSYGAAIYVDYGYRVQSIPIVINVAADDYEFEFGGPSAFDTPYNNDIQGIADKAWRFEVGDWRMYWAEPSVMPPSDTAYLAAIVNWTELPTDVNMHILAPYWDWWPQWNAPLGPGWLMTPIASSDERYMGAGTFGVYTNTGRAQEVQSVPFGAWYYWNVGTPAPFMILTRCSVMSGNASYDTLEGYTTWFTINDYQPQWISLWAPQPGPVPLEGEQPAWYDVTVNGQVEVKGSGVGPYMRTSYWGEPIYQDTLTGDFYADLANAMYTRYLWLEDSSMLDVETWENWNAPDIDLGVWFDEDMDGVAELSEPYWASGTSGSNEHVRVYSPADGQWIIKVLGYTVSGDPGYFDMNVLTGVPGYILATDLESPASSGVHNFNVSYSVPAMVGVFEGYATFGFYGADDTFDIYFQIQVEDWDAPQFDYLSPADGSELGTNHLYVSFRVNDTPFDSDILWWTLSVYLDGSIDVLPVSSWWIWDNWVYVDFPYALADGWHWLDISVYDTYWNYGWSSSGFLVNTAIEDFEAWFLDPSTGGYIPNGDTVSLTYVDMEGYTDPEAYVCVYQPWAAYWTQADVGGYWYVPDIWLAEGLNIMTVVTVTLGGVSDSMIMMLTSDTVCRLWVDDIASPTSSSTVTVRGWTDPYADLLVNEVPTAVETDGSFSTTVALSEGMNAIYVNATDPVGNTAYETIDVELDTTAPALVILGPADGSNTSEPSVLVFGTTEAGATVHVNGVLASDGSADWEATIVLSEGVNTVTVTAEDALGNMATDTISVEYIPPVYVTPEELQAVQDLLTDMLNNLSAALSENVTDLQGQIDDLATALGDNVSDLQAQIDALSAQLAADIAALQALIDALDDALGENVTALEADIAALQADIAALQAALTSSVDDLQGQIDDAEDAIDQLDADLGDLQDQLNDVNESLQDQVGDVEEQAADTDAFASMLMYLTIVLFAIAVGLIGVIYWLVNSKVKGGGSGGAGSMEEVEPPPSEVEKEFEALEKEIKQEEL